jgi:hypothetical protein
MGWDARPWRVSGCCRTHAGTKNYFVYFHPVTKEALMLPWDMDGSFGERARCERTPHMSDAFSTRFPTPEARVLSDAQSCQLAPLCQAHLERASLLLVKSRRWVRSAGQDNGLGGQPNLDNYCVLACEQWNSPLYW